MNQFRSDANLSIWLVRIVDNKALERVRRCYVPLYLGSSGGVYLGIK
jgi:hypothetical protein